MDVSACGFRPFVSGLSEMVHECLISGVDLIAPGIVDGLHSPFFIQIECEIIAGQAFKNTALVADSMHGCTCKACGDIAIQFDIYEVCDFHIVMPVETDPF